MKKTKLILFTLFVMYGSSLWSQDVHFSQFFSAPLYTNPANAGNYQGDYRFVLNNKNQWNAFTNAYTTFAGSFETGFDNILKKDSRLGAGIQINNDIAGDGKFGTTQFYLNIAYCLPVDKSSKINLALGINGGYVMHGINFNNLYFGNQYDGEQYVPELPSGESISFDKISYADFGAGLLAKYKYKPNLNFEAGFAVNHILQPSRSFYENSDAFLPIKYTITASAEYNIKDDLWIEPHLLAMFQQKHQETNFGALLRFDYNPVTLQSLYFGTFMRSRDAGIFVLGFKYHNVRICFNYDINLSKLSTISRGKGGAEFSIIYIFLKPRPFQAPDYRKCPDFI
jgi:type IX secretion system PorP/SprF family membrane protein